VESFRECGNAELSCDACSMGNGLMTLYLVSTTYSSRYLKMSMTSPFALSVVVCDGAVSFETTSRRLDVNVNGENEIRCDYLVQSLKFKSRNAC
jgi:hypothetical protein